MYEEDSLTAGSRHGLNLASTPQSCKRRVELIGLNTEHFRDFPLVFLMGSSLLPSEDRRLAILNHDAIVSAVFAAKVNFCARYSDWPCVCQITCANCGHSLLGRGCKVFACLAENRPRSACFNVGLELLEPPSETTSHFCRVN